MPTISASSMFSEMLQGLRLADHLLTTNDVIAETITLTRKIGHAEATRLSDQLYNERLTMVSVAWETT